MISDPVVRTLLTNTSALLDSIKADHGYNMDSNTVRNLLQTMSSFDPAQRRDFLQFITGSPKLPIGGMFDHLASRMTCANIYCRFQEPHTNVHCGVQAQRAPVYIG